MDYYEAIRQELDQCVKNAGKRQEAMHYGAEVKPKFTINRNMAKPMFSRTYAPHNLI